jgi:hypothetical protein
LRARLASGCCSDESTAIDTGCAHIQLTATTVGDGHTGVHRLRPGLRIRLAAGCRSNEATAVDAGIYPAATTFHIPLHAWAVG